ncbi:MAG: AMP-binding protein [Deltaproteobacteria bacterium]|nr:AMP-binding protein [Nannocystaceae bacterium]
MSEAFDPTAPSWPALLPSERVAPVLDDEDVDQVRAEASTIAAHLHGAREVVLACEDRRHFVLAALAAWGRDAQVVLAPNLRPAVVAGIAQRLQLGLVVHDGGHEHGLDVRTLAPAERDGLLHAAPIPGDLAFARLYTSGSTGEPKAIPKLARQLLGEAVLLAHAFGIGPDARVLSTVPPHHIYGLLFGVLVPLVAGATIITAAPLLPEEVALAIAHHRASVLIAAPVHLRAFEVLAPGALAGLSRVFCSGGPLPHESATLMRERLGAPVTEILGSSETGGMAWRLHDREPPPFVALPGVAITHDDDGRMQLRSPLLDPALPQPHATEDRIVRCDGGFVHLGRIDDVVKIAGRRVALGEVEARVRALPGIDDVAAVRLVAHDGRGEAIALVVATRVQRPESIRAGLTAWFDLSSLPRRIVCVDALPREPSGKLARSAALALLGEPVTTARTLELRLLSGDAGHARFAIDIDPRLPWFEGHFPGFPLLPGVVQLERIGLAAIARAWPELGAPRGFPRVKFLEAIAPGDTLELRLRRRDAATVELELMRGDQPCMRGTAVFEP